LGVKSLRKKKKKGEKRKKEKFLVTQTRKEKMKKNGILREAEADFEDYILEFAGDKIVRVFWDSKEGNSAKISKEVVLISGDEWESLVNLEGAYLERDIPVVVDVNEAGSVDLTTIGFDYERVDVSQICDDKFLPLEKKGQQEVGVRNLQEATES